ncbi:MAG TPA: ATP-binding protein [Bryobacteraceae bacterium]|nr:ATP-binding protein [Bryobacteraceae bacterium]
MTDSSNSSGFLLGSRVALLAGFGSLLLIMTAAGVDALRVLRDFRQNDDRIRRQFLYQNHLLNGIRSQVYLSGTYVRDYLLDPDPKRADAYRAELEQLRKQVDTAVESYGRQPVDASHYTALKSELAEYWQILEPIFQWDSAERQRAGYAFLRDAVFPRRQNMLAIADRIAAINEQQLNAGNELVVGLLSRFRTRLAVTLFTAVILGIGMAAFTTSRILKLETRAHNRFQEVAEARRQLTELSARLVQAQETERRAISRELHDEVGQSLSGVLIELRNLSPRLARPDDRSRVESMKGLVENTIRVVRNMALLLRPSMLDDLGLVPALKWQAREVSKRSGMEVSVAADVADDLPDDYKTCIYRVVQEALHNCSSHARASSVRIRAQQERDSLKLSIQDDGRGFDAAHVKGMGLLGIQERVARLGGKCEVHSEPGAGAVLNIELPILHAFESTRETREPDSHTVSG